MNSNKYYYDPSRNVYVEREEYDAGREIFREAHRGGIVITLSPSEFKVLRID